MGSFASITVIGRSSPELLKPRRVGCGVLDGVLDVPMPQIILNEPRIRVLIGKGEPASVAQHVGMGEQGQGCGGAVFSQGEVHGGSVQRLPLLTHKERLAGRLHPGAFFQPNPNDPQLVASQRRRGRINARELHEQMNSCSCLTLLLACVIYWQAKEISRVLKMGVPQGEDIDFSLLEHVSPIEWENVILYGQYVIDPEQIR